MLVDDGSTDGSWAAICEAARNNAFVVAAKLSRNFGQHTAIAAGLDLAQGDAVVVMGIVTYRIALRRFRGCMSNCSAMTMSIALSHYARTEKDSFFKN